MGVQQVPPEGGQVVVVGVVLAFQDRGPDLVDPVPVETPWAERYRLAEVAGDQCDQVPVDPVGVLPEGRLHGLRVEDVVRKFGLVPETDHLLAQQPVAVVRITGEGVLVGEPGRLNRGRAGR